jgi:hypothetical protein
VRTAGSHQPGRELRFGGQDPLAVYRSFCAAIMLTRAVAEAV